MLSRCRLHSAASTLLLFSVTTPCAVQVGASAFLAAPAAAAPPPRHLGIHRAAAATSSTESERLEAWKTDLTLQDLQDLLQTAETAARAAGTILKAHTGCGSHASSISDEQAETEQQQSFEIKSSIKDIVTRYDKEAQTALEEIIRAAYPEHSFLGEEDVAAGAAASEAALLQILQRQNNEHEKQESSGFLWIADPIDGTANFASGLALSAVTMGCCYQGTPVVGVVFDPHANEMFSAIKGQGATVMSPTTTNNTRQKLQVAHAVTHVQDAIVNAGCPADPNAFQASMRGVLALNGRTRGLRMIACSALTTSWIAAGRLTAHFGYDLSSWDLVAGALLIQEAGGRVTDLDGTPYRLETRNMLCSNGNEQVHAQVLDILRQANAVSFTRTKVQ